MQDPFTEREDEDQTHNPELHEDKDTEELVKTASDSQAETEERPKPDSSETIEIKRPKKTH
jgi:hypothetical protein